MTKPLKIVFAGTPAIAQIVLAQILEAGFKIDLVLTQPDRPAGRGMKLSASPVKQLALEYNLELAQPVSFKAEPAVIEQIRQLQPDLLVVVAYGLLLPASLLAIPRLGCINLHVSLLPRDRGAAPIQRAVLAGDKVSGISIMLMDEGLDTGPILLTRQLSLAEDETSGSLHDRLATLGASAMLEYLASPETYLPQMQPTLGATYAPKIDKEEARINWHEPAAIIARKVRGYNPFPGAFCFLDGTLHKIWAAVPVAGKITNAEAGTIVEVRENELIVACGENSCLAITELQEAGSVRKSAKIYQNIKVNLVGKRLVSR